MGDLLELDREVHRRDADRRGHAHRARREVEDPAHARGDEAVGHLLRDGGRHREDGDLDSELVDDAVELLHRVDLDAAVAPAVQLRVGVEHGDDLESLLDESLVADERLAEVADADDRAAAGAVGAEDALDLLDERIDAVADPRQAELAEVGQVLAHLRGREPQVAGELARGDGRAVVVAQRLQPA